MILTFEYNFKKKAQTSAQSMLHFDLNSTVDLLEEALKEMNEEENAAKRPKLSNVKLYEEEDDDDENEPTMLLSDSENESEREFGSFRRSNKLRLSINEEDNE